MWKKINPKDLKPDDIFAMGNDNPSILYIQYPLVVAKQIIDKNNNPIIITKDGDSCSHSGTGIFWQFFIWTGQKGIPPTYKVSKSCKNCKFVFVREERKAPTEYYCHFDNSERPLCGSIFMGESEINPGFSWKVWENWKAEHLIKDELGHCEKWRKKELE